MPTLTLPDGTVLSWTTGTPSDAPPASTTFATLDAAPDSPMPTSPPDITAGSSSPSTPPVPAPLVKIPQRWTATVSRFLRTLVAGCMAAFAIAWVSAGSTIEGVTRDPQAFLVAIGTAVFMAIEKFVRWKG